MATAWAILGSGEVDLQPFPPPRGRRSSFLGSFKTLSSSASLHNYILSLVLASLHIISVRSLFTIPSISAFLPLAIAHVKRSRKFAVRVTLSLCWRTAWLVITWLVWRRSRYLMHNFFLVYCTLYFIKRWTLVYVFHFLKCHLMVPNMVMFVTFAIWTHTKKNTSDLHSQKWTP